MTASNDWVKAADLQVGDEIAAFKQRRTVVELVPETKYSAAGAALSGTEGDARIAVFGSDIVFRYAKAGDPQSPVDPPPVLDILLDGIQSTINGLTGVLAAARAASDTPPQGRVEQAVSLTFDVPLTLIVDLEAGVVVEAIIQTPNVSSLVELRSGAGIAAGTADRRFGVSNAEADDAIKVADNEAWPTARYEA